MSDKKKDQKSPVSISTTLTNHINNVFIYKTMHYQHPYNPNNLYQQQTATQQRNNTFNINHGYLASSQRVTIPPNNNFAQYH